MEGLHLTRHGRRFLAALDGELANERVVAARQELEQALADAGSTGLVVDLSGVSFLDSSGIGLLVSLAAQARAAGRGFHLLAPSPQARKTLELVQLIRYFDILPSRDSLSGLEPRDNVAGA